MPLDSIIKQLQTLSKDDLQELIKQAIFYRDLNRKPSVAIQPPKRKPRTVVATSEFVPMILLYAKKYTLVPYSPPDAYMMRLNSISKDLEHVSKILNLDRRQKTRLVDTLLYAAKCNLEQKDRVMSFRTLLYAISDPKSVLLEAYPGYFGTAFFRDKVLDAKAK
jgi:hypothetical protein